MAEDEAQASGSRRWFIGFAGGLVGAGVLYGLSRAGFRVWMDQSLPDDAPRIAFSLDDTWLNQLGITDTTYQQAMTRAGGRLDRYTPERTDGADAKQAVTQLLDDQPVDGVLLTGGGDVDPALYGGDTDAALLVNRARDDFEIALIHEATARGLPILGICRGCQILNVAFGGTLRNLRDDEALNDAHFSFGGHAVTLTPGSQLQAILATNTLHEVLSFHGQSADEPGEGISVAARGPGDVIEAIEIAPRGWAIGVQWHPEMVPGSEIHAKLFEAFINQASLVRTTRASA